MRGKNILGGILSTVCILSVGFGCLSFNSFADAEKEVEIFHQRLNNQNFDEIYNSAHSKFKEKTTRESAFNLFSSVQTKYGTLVNTKVTYRKSKTKNGITVASLFYESEYSKTKVIETFEFSTEDEMLKLTIYNINTK